MQSDDLGLVPVAWRYRYKTDRTGDEWDDWITVDVDPNDWDWAPAWHYFEAEPLYDAAAIERLVAERDEARKLAATLLSAGQEDLVLMRETASTLTSLRQRADAAEAQRDKLKEALTELVNAKAIGGVREIVAGWNGENRPDGPYERHPAQLGATLPKTDCGSVYELDEAMQRARQALGDT